MSGEAPVAAAAVLAQRRRFPFNLPTLYSGKEWWWAAARVTVVPLYAQQCPTAVYTARSYTRIMSKRRKVGLWHEIVRSRRATP